MIHKNHLPNQRKEEHVILQLRRHWTVPAKIIFFFFLTSALPVTIYFFIRSEFPSLLTDPLIAPALGLVTSFAYLAIWIFTFQEIIDYYLDLWFVTNERIINIEQHGLFTRTAAELHLNAVADVTSEVRGVAHTFLNFGDVFVQTAAEKTRFHFKQIPRPEKVRETILRAVDEDHQRHQKQD